MTAEQVLFRLTGRSPARGSGAAPKLRPALFARFGDLTRLRYDHPVVLVTPAADGTFARPLSGIVDEALRAVAPRGIGGERMRRSALRLEREIRRLSAAGERGTLDALWQRALDGLAVTAGADVVSELARVRAAIRVDGELIGPDASGTAALVTHVWRAAQGRKAAALRRAIDDLIVRLSGLVSADLLRSDAGRDADHLRAAIGAPHRELFDFDAMARLVAGPSRGLALPASRRERIARVIAALRAHRALVEDLEAYVFDSADTATAAYQKRLPAMAALVAAIAMGDLEIAGRYVEAEHDAFFGAFDAADLTPEDIALFPDPLVRTGSTSADPSRHGAVLESLSSGLPLKILVGTDDVFGSGAHLASSVLGLGDVYVVQAASSELARIAARVRAAIEHPGPVLLSVFTGGLDGIPAYLASAAAKESRAFPTFSYDPSADGGWSARLSLEGDPQPEETWPFYELRYADESFQRVSERVPFTLADLAVCDPRRSRDLARLLPGAVPGGDLVPLADWLAGRAAPSPTAVPYVNAIDADDRLVRLVVDDRLVRETRRSGEAWKRLVELATPPRKAAGDVEGGRAVSREGAEPSSRPDEASSPAATAQDGASASDRSAKRETPEATSPAAGTEASPDEAYIETVRCATCNECTNINPRMFKYNENKQAYIADLKAGTYRELVEAAESCQVAIIHPGKPRDPSEPGLAELLGRAAAFA